MSNLPTSHIESYIESLNESINSFVLKNEKDPNSKSNHEHLQSVSATFQNLVPEIASPVTTLKIGLSEIYGRFLEAATDIKKGDIIFVEKPLVIAPRNGSGPACLNCFRSLPDEEWPVCSNCKAPKCKEKCYDSYHTKEECTILANVFSNNLSKQTDIQWVKFINLILTPLRTHLQIKNRKNSVQLLNSLQSNINSRKMTIIGNFIEKYVIPFFESELPELELNKEFIRHVCGVFDTNAFEITMKSNSPARALLPLASIMHHSCCANTSHWFHIGHCIVRASVNIKKGEAITNSYTQTLWSTSTRKSHLRLTKYFTCTCSRCEDFSEFETYLSSVACQRCNEGLLIPPKTKGNNLWKCNKCKDLMQFSSLNNILTIASGVVAMAPKMETETLLKANARLNKVLGSQHSSTVQLQYLFVKHLINSLTGKTSYICKLMLISAYCLLI